MLSSKMKYFDFEVQLGRIVYVVADFYEMRSAGSGAKLHILYTSVPTV
jgi:hypothetical protein